MGMEGFGKLFRYLGKRKQRTDLARKHFFGKMRSIGEVAEWSKAPDC